VNQIAQGAVEGLQHFLLACALVSFCFVTLTAACAAVYTRRNL
jgi:hypothetical protein